jgi:hypothetical protein
MLSTQFNQVTGMFGGPYANYKGTGNYGYGFYWNNYPNIIGGLSNIDRMATETGSNLSAVKQLSPDVVDWGKRQMGDDSQLSVGQGGTSY